MGAADHEGAVFFGGRREGRGVVKHWRALADLRCITVIDQTHSPPDGPFGGQSAAANLSVMNAESSVETRLGKDSGVVLPAGGEWHLRTAGGGGWDVPWERDSRLLTSLARRLFAIGCPPGWIHPTMQPACQKKNIVYQELGGPVGFVVSVGEHTLFECGHFRTRFHASLAAKLLPKKRHRLDLVVAIFRGGEVFRLTRTRRGDCGPACTPRLRDARVHAHCGHDGSAKSTPKLHPERRETDTQRGMA